MSRAAALLMICLCSSCVVRVYVNADYYGTEGYKDQQKGRYPPFEQAGSFQPDDTLVLAYEARAADFKQPDSAGRYQWIIPHANVCVIFPRSLPAWKGFIDSLRVAGAIDLHLVATNYHRRLLQDYREWLREQHWTEPIYVMSNAAYGHKRKRKKRRFLQELAGPQADTRFAFVEHVLIDPKGRCVYLAREDEDPQNKGAKPRTRIEAEIRDLLARRQP